MTPLSVSSVGLPRACYPPAGSEQAQHGSTGRAPVTVRQVANRRDASAWFRWRSITSHGIPATYRRSCWMSALVTSASGAVLLARFTAASRRFEQAKG